MLTPKQVWEQVRDLDLHEIKGGAFQFDLIDLPNLFKIPWMQTDSEAHPALRVEPDPQLELKDLMASATALEGGGVILGYDEGGSRFQGLRDLEELADLMVADGVTAETFELLTSGDEDYARQRYCGLLKGGVVELTHSSLKLDLETLKKAYRLGVEGDESIALDSPELASRAEELALEFFDGTTMEVIREGAVLTAYSQGEPDPAIAELVRIYAFRATFEESGPWTFPDEDDVDDGVAALNAQLSQLFTAADPGGEKLVLDGEFGRFFTGDLLSLPQIVPEDSRILDLEMKELGLEPLGDMTCNKILHVVMRGYAGSDGLFALGSASAGGVFCVEFYTAFEDGWSITTSTNPGAVSRPKKKIQRSHHSEQEPVGLLELHRQALKEKGAQPVVRERSLKGLAEAIDEYMQRQGEFLF